MEMNLVEKFGIKSAMEPVDMNTAAITGARISMASSRKIAIVINMGDSVAAVADFTLKQHNAASAGTSKDLSIMNSYFVKAGAATSFTKVSPTVAAANYVLSSTFAAEPGIVVFEVNAEDLDVNGGFTHVSLDIADSTAAKLCSVLYFAEKEYIPAYDIAL